MTKARKELHTVISSAQVPLTAKEIHDILKKRYDLVTVYRGLSYLESKGMVSSFSFHCSKEGMERYYFRYNQPHVHFFHCSSCHQFIPLEVCALDQLESRIEQDYGLSIHEHTLYFTGLCRNCK